MALKVITGLSSVLFVGVAAVGLLGAPRAGSLWLLGMVGMPLTIWVGAWLFSIRGYVLTPDALVVKRPGWSYRLALTGLISADRDPSAMRRSPRLWGNGGLFSISEWFRNKKIELYRAFAADPKCSVGLKFDRRVVVVTPGDPEMFVTYVKQWRAV